MVASGDAIIVPAWDVYALDRSTGAIRWTFTQTDDYPGYTGIAAADGLVYTAGRRLYALDASTGELRWQVDLEERPFRPIVAGGVLYVETRAAIDTVPGGLNTLGNGHAMALDAATGALLWSYPIEDPNPVLGGSVGPAFVTSELVIVAGENSRIYALDRVTGQPRWIATGSGPYPAGVVVVDSTVIAAGDAGKIDGFDLATGELRWQRENSVDVMTGEFILPAKGSSVFVPITTANDVALIAGGWVVAVDAAGNFRWHDGGAGFGGPVYSTSATYFNGTIYVGSLGSPRPGFYALQVPMD